MEQESVIARNIDHVESLGIRLAAGAVGISPSSL